MTMTTIATGHQRTPLIAALAAGAALVVGGAIGVAWEQHNDTPAAIQSHSTAPVSFGGATTSDEISGSVPATGTSGGATTSDEFSGSVPATGSPGGATTSDEFSGSTSGSLPATGSPGGATTSQESTQ
jgi:hypothetical protein